MNEPLQDCRQDGRTDARLVGDYMRYTRLQHARGDSAGWRFECGWFQRASGLEWAWFSRPIEEKEVPPWK
jgi:hypothetical protein